MLLRARTEWRARLPTWCAALAQRVPRLLVLTGMMLATLVPWVELFHALAQPSPAVSAHTAPVLGVLSVLAWWAGRREKGAAGAVWRAGAAALSLGALTAAMEVAQATVLRHQAAAVLAAPGALFLACGWLAVRAVQATDAFLRSTLMHPLQRCAGALTAASVGVAVLAAPLLPPLCDTNPTGLPLGRAGGAGAAVDVHFLSHWSLLGDAPVLVRSGPLLLVSEERALVWVERHGVRHVAPTDTFPASTHVLMHATARVSDLVAAADVAISRGAREVVWVLPHPAPPPVRLSPSERRRVTSMLTCVVGEVGSDALEEDPAFEEAEATRPPCTPTRYDLTQAMTGALERGPMTIRAVSHPSHATRGLPWTDELGPLGTMSLTEVLHRGLTVRLQRWAPPQAGLTVRALMVHGLLAGLALGLALFWLRFVLSALAAGQLARTRGALPRAAAATYPTASTFPAWLPRAHATNVEGGGSPYRATPGVATANTGVVVQVGFGRLRGPLALVLAAMLVLSGALLLAPAP